MRGSEVDLGVIKALLYTYKQGVRIELAEIVALLTVNPALFAVTAILLWIPRSLLVTD